MSASGPFILGGGSINNATSMQITSQVSVPHGAMIVVAISTSAPDVTNVVVTDSVGNTYNVQVDSQPPGSPVTLFVLYALNAIALPQGGTITVTMPSRFSIVAGALYYTGVQGSFTASDVEWFSGTQCAYSVTVKAGDNLLALMSVNGPQSDGFVQDPNYGPDLGTGIGGQSFSVHGGSAVATAAGSFGYNPTLGQARNSVGFLLAFR